MANVESTFHRCSENPDVMVLEHWVTRSVLNPAQDWQYVSSAVSQRRLIGGTFITVLNLDLCVGKRHVIKLEDTCCSERRGTPGRRSSCWWWILLKGVSMEAAEAARVAFVEPVWYFQIKTAKHVARNSMLTKRLQLESERVRLNTAGHKLQPWSY